MKEFAVVTGAGTGLGRCFALELARHGQAAHAVAAQARETGAESIVIEADLTDREAISRLCSVLNSNYRISMLINNAGTGGSALFTECSDDYIDNIIRLNVTAVALLTHGLIPNLMKARKSYILNVSSMAAFTPTGYKTVYPATKRFVLEFTRGLQQELHGTGISVCCIHPGPMKTNPDVTHRIERQGRFGKIGLLSPENVARTGIERMLKGESVIIPGWMNKLNKFLTDIIPVSIRLPLVSRIISREVKGISPTGENIA